MNPKIFSTESSCQSRAHEATASLLKLTNFTFEGLKFREFFEKFVKYLSHKRNLLCGGLVMVDCVPELYMMYACFHDNGVL